MKRGLLEAAVAARAEKRPVVVLRCLDADEQWLLDEATDPATVDGLSDELRAECAEAFRRDGARVVESGGKTYLVQTLSPPYRLIVVGAVHIAQSLIPMARMAGYTPVLIDPRPAFASEARFPGVEVHNGWPQDVMPELALTRRSAVVTLSHDPKIDEPALATALRSEAFFIGALGSRRNHAGRLQRLAELGFDAASLDRIAGPVGLDLGGRAPAEIAVAILAQMIRVRYRGRDAA